MTKTHPGQAAVRALALLFFSTLVIYGKTQKPLTGFTPAGTASEQQNEAVFDQALNRERIGATIRELSSKPHHISSARGKEVAEYIRQRLANAGFDARIETFRVLFPTPKERVLEMTNAGGYKAVLKELSVAEDATSGQEGQLPTYNAWSADGDVTAPLVFVNYGLPADYEELDRRGISVKGKIVIAKYGRSWRGTKPKVAQEHGAVGCLIYSDPADDGYARGDVYPKGAFKNEYGVQRGSVMDMVIYPGDPLTPGTGATENADRLERSKATNLLKIPVLPISYHDALPFLEQLSGPVAPAEWRGALPITYHIGPGSIPVHLKLGFDWALRPCYDVIGTIRGAKYPDEWVIRGNHHDAWVNGASDPISGMASMLDEADGIGALLKTGWKPERTIVYCGWDGEEPGLLGSTEWLETHEQELRKKAVIYINSDDSGRGFFGAGGSHALEPMVEEVARDVRDPEKGVSVLERKRAQSIVSAAPAARKEIMSRTNMRLEALGSGSDYSSFLQHAGIPSLNIGYGGEDAGGEYHSIFDSYDDYTRFKDPGFVYGVTLAQTGGRIALRMADAKVLPFRFHNLEETVRSYVSELVSLADQMRESTRAENGLIGSGMYRLAADPEKNIADPQPRADVPYLDFSPVQNALAELDSASRKMDQAARRALDRDADPIAVNTVLMHAEQQLLMSGGLPHRPWYRHALYAPGFYTGYGVKTMPGIREAIEQRDWPLAGRQIAEAATALRALATYLEKNAQKLS